MLLVKKIAIYNWTVSCGVQCITGKNRTINVLINSLTIKRASLTRHTASKIVKVCVYKFMKKVLARKAFRTSLIHATKPKSVTHQQYLCNI